MTGGVAAVPPFGGEVNGGVPDLEAGREVPAAAKCADGRERRLEVGLAPAGAVEERRDAELFNGEPAGATVDQRSVHHQEGRHAFVMPEVRRRGLDGEFTDRSSGMSLRISVAIVGASASPCASTSARVQTGRRWYAGFSQMLPSNAARRLSSQAWVKSRAATASSCSHGGRCLEMVRYRPSHWLADPVEETAEVQLGGLLQSQLLKRFESSWKACLATVERMIQAHDAFIEAWERGVVLSREALVDAARAETGEAGISAWVEQTLAEGDDARPVAEFQPEYGEAVARDRERLEAIRLRLAAITPATDPKLRLIQDLLEASPAEKIAVFATYGETIEYLDENLPALVGGRERVTVVGSSSSPDERTKLIARFAPRTVVGPDYVPADGEVGLLLSTDVLSEGQNLQQAQAVISYDMPWNPQRVVQRNGRVIRQCRVLDDGAACYPREGLFARTSIDSTQHLGLRCVHAGRFADRARDRR